MYAEGIASSLRLLCFKEVSMARMNFSRRTLITTVGITAFAIAWLTAALEAVRYTPKAY